MDTHALQCTGSPAEIRLETALGTETRAEAFRRNQVLDRLNAEMMKFVAEQRMVFVATADASGAADCSPRFGPPGFVRILSPKYLCWPEYRGNGVLASLANVSDNPHLGLLFVDFESARIGLHVNGRAGIMSNEAMARHPARTRLIEEDLAVVGGRRPERWVMVLVQEAYVHCSKHIPSMRIQTRIEDIPWGTDDERAKRGDFFLARQTRRSWAEEASTEGAGAPAANGRWHLDGPWDRLTERSVLAEEVTRPLPGREKPAGALVGPPGQG